MTFARAWSVALVGVDAHLVEVEADLALGLPGLTVTGLPDASLSEARDRVRAAVVNSGETWPQRRITLGLSPAWLPKRGSGFDLALAAAVLAASGAVPPDSLADRVLLGELGLNGDVRAVRGVLPGVDRRPLARGPARRRAGGQPGRGPAAARRRRGGRRDAARAARPAARGGAAARARGAGAAERAGSLRWTCSTSRGRSSGGPPSRSRPPAVTTCSCIGPPGSGKTMLAERLPGILPPLARAAGAGGHRRPLGRRHAPAGLAPGLPRAVPGPAPHLLGGRGRRRWQRHRAPRGGEPGAPRGAVPGRGPGVRVRGAGRAAAAAGERSADAAQGRGRGELPGPLPAGAGRQPLPVRSPRVPVHLPARGPAALPHPAVRTAAGPDRPAGRGPWHHPGRDPGRGRAGRAERGRRRPGGRSAGGGRTALRRHAVAGQRRGPGLRAAPSLAAAAQRHRRARERARRRAGDRPRLRPRAPGGVDAGRPAGLLPSRRSRRSTRRSATACAPSAEVAA